MVPPYKSSTLFLTEPLQIISKPDYEQHLKVQPKSQVKTSHHQHRWQIVWRNVLIFAYLHVAALYGLYYAFTLAQKKTIVWAIGVGISSTLGVTCGAHRLWAHKTYKAKLPFRIYLAFWQTVALQNSIFEWARDHRVHHKFTDTDADPHNSNRGFFFSHMGWLVVKKHRDVFTKGKTIDMSDLEADPVVKFQKKYYLVLAPLLCFGFPAFVPWYFWNENFSVCWYSAVLRYMLTLHGTWCINSVAHMFGTKPFDKNINAVENKTMAFIGCGEGWHNYHHVFPWDYKAAEFGNYSFNLSVALIDFMAKIGWAYDLKTVPVDMIVRRAKRTGDGTRKYDDISDKIQETHRPDDNVWGWDDKDMTQEERKMTEIHHINCDN